MKDVTVWKYNNDHVVIWVIILIFLFIFSLYCKSWAFTIMIIVTSRIWSRTAHCMIISIVLFMLSFVISPIRSVQIPNTYDKKAWILSVCAAAPVVAGTLCSAASWILRRCAMECTISWMTQRVSVPNVSLFALDSNSKQRKLCSSSCRRWNPVLGRFLNSAQVCNGMHDIMNDASCECA